MKTKYKVVLLTVCAVLLIASAAFGTIAYLTDQETVENTFTVGQVGITLDETDVDTAGVKDGDTRVQANEYHLIPGHSYTKDPTVHVDANSENCYLFVKVVNAIVDIESKDKDYATIANQIEVNGWTALDGVANVYYKEHTKAEIVTDYLVFSNFKIDGASVTNEILAPYQGKTIVVTAYAIQQDGFANAKAAWEAGKFN